MSKLQLRRDYLAPDVAEKLFAAEEVQARFMFDSIALQQNKELSDEERRARQADLRQQMNQRLLNLEQLDPEVLAANRVQVLRANGASEDEIFSTRQQLLGVERARSLTAADQEEALWQQQFDVYWQARRRISQAGLSQEDEQQQIEELMHQYFRDEEIDRARETELIRRALNN